ncbi:hypothetical protein BV898_15950 [Hypsibius exemplaris]|uniref:Uncharacterized protein n=1 Tax=Hypsibius exemplaris TaxID=2072580 RepID=A0A9X6RKT8_HYPEX|nr:hypothetical protein BV898_15950 [Hypsibius exemplaris]
MTKAQPKVPPEVADVLSGRNPFLRYSQPSHIFRDVFDFGDQSLLRKDIDDEFNKVGEISSPGGRILPKHMTMVKHARKPPQPKHGYWKWDSKLGFLFVPTDQIHADAKNETREAAHRREALKLTGKVGYKEHRHPADKIIEAFARLIKDKAPDTDILVDESRQVELDDIKRGALHLTKYTLHHRIPQNVQPYYDKFNCVRGIQTFIQFGS